MLKQIDHIGIAVTNLQEVIQTYQLAFGLQPYFEEEIDDQKAKVVGFKVGDATIEFLEPTAHDSPLTKFLESRGNGIHHMTFRVENLQDTLEQLRSKGFTLIDEKHRKGAEDKKIAFLHPKSFNGILIELCEI